jgi:hypothetical protein
MEMNVENTRHPPQVQIKVHQKQLENIKYFLYLGSMITSAAKCAREIKSRVVTVNAAFNKKNTLFTSKLGLKLKKKLAKCYICDKTWTLRKVDQKYLGSFEIWCWGRM